MFTFYVRDFIEVLLKAGFNNTSLWDQIFEKLGGVKRFQNEDVESTIELRNMILAAFPNEIKVISKMEMRIVFLLFNFGKHKGQEVRFSEFVLKVQPENQNTELDRQKLRRDFARRKILRNSSGKKMTA